MGHTYTFKDGRTIEASDDFGLKACKTWVFYPQDTPEADGKICFGYGIQGEANAYRRDLEAHYGVKYKIEALEEPDARRLWNDNHTNITFLHCKI